jgi:hypothetical protein
VLADYALVSSLEAIEVKVREGLGVVYDQTPGSKQLLPHFLPYGYKYI